MILSHIPRFFGLEQVGFTNGITVYEDFLVLEDITEGFLNPSIMDVKIGTQTWGPDASEEKIAKESAKYVGTKGPLGFSILGMIVHSFDSQKSQKFDKSFGKNLKCEQVHLVPETFFCNGEKPPKKLVKIVVDKMKAIRDVFEMQRKYKIYASSLLLAYDASKVRSENLDEKCVNIRLIDFAHVFDADGQRDDNFLGGINNLIQVFENYYSRIQ